MSIRREKLVVVGNGMAGARAVAELLKRAPARYDIVVFGAEPHPNYNRILLSSVLAGETPPDDIVINRPRWYLANGVALFTGDPVIALDPAARIVTSAAGRRVGYDKLLLATGSEPLTPPIAGLDLPGVGTFRTIDDVATMIEAAARHPRAVVIGGGLLGLEAAWGLGQRGMRVVVVHLMPTLLERQLDVTASQLLQRDLERRGLAFVTQGSAEAILGDRRAEAVRLADGREIAADLVVMAIGVRPEIGLARRAGLDVNRGIVVGDDMRTSDPNIYAIGECAEHAGQCFGLVAPLWEMARVCAERLTGSDIASFATPVVSAQLKIAGIDMFSAGVPTAAAGDEEITLQDTAAGAYRKLVVRHGKIVGAVLYGDIAEGGWYLQLIGDGTAIASIRPRIIFGRPAIETAGAQLGRRSTGSSSPYCRTEAPIGVSGAVWRAADNLVKSANG